MREVSFSTLKGLTLSRVDVHRGGGGGSDEDGDRITFSSTDGRTFTMFHHSDCCESVEIDDICGDIDALVGSPILVANESTNSDKPREQEYPDESFTWTFYTLANINEAVTIRWYGSSNGYYSEGVDFEEQTDV